MIVVLGYGRETRAWLHRRALDPAETVLVLDERPSDDLAVSSWMHARVDLDDVASVRRAIAGRTVDDVVRSPGVSPYRAGAEWLIAQAPSATPTGRWLVEQRPRDLIAVTGTKGKSTVAAMTAHLLCAAGRSTTLAGNIGHALTAVDPAAPRDDLVVELSSYQLADLTLARPAAAAAITTLFVDHVPWHGTVARYHADKLRLFDLADWCVVGHQVAALGVAAGRFDAVAPNATPSVLAALARAGLHGPHHADAAMLALALVDRRLPGGAADLAPALADFAPLPHRLQPVATARGRTFVDDSIATVPEAALAALATWRPRGPVTLLLGGEDRGQSVDALVTALGDTEVRAALIPPFGIRIGAAIRAADPIDHSTRVVEVPDLAAGVAWADEVTPSGGAVLLSPSAPSFGAFRDFEHRGETFADLVRALPGAEALGPPRRDA